MSPGRPAWALVARAETNVSDAQLAELDDFELASRGGDIARRRYLDARMGHVAAALVATAGAMKGRMELLRTVDTLCAVLKGAETTLVADAVCGIASAEMGAGFVAPLLNIAVERVSDARLSGAAADALAVLLGSTALDDCIRGVLPAAVRDAANEETRRFVNSLITEIALTASPRALGALGALLRRDFARVAFCHRDGLSTLADTLLTEPGTAHTSIGKAVSGGDAENTTADAVAATYHAVFAVWMLSFSTSSDSVQVLLSCALSTRLVLVLANLLDHASGQRIKIARLTLASLRNLATGTTDLHSRIRKDMVAAEIPVVLDRLMRHGTGPGSVLGRDSEAIDDAQFLAELLQHEQSAMSTVEMYVAELRSGALHWSAIHRNAGFWTANAQTLVSSNREVLSMLADVIAGNVDASDEARSVACSDLAHVLRESVTGRAAALSHPNLKRDLMNLMTSAGDPSVKGAALTCVQLLLLPRR